MLRYKFALLAAATVIVGVCGKYALSEPATTVAAKCTSQPVAANENAATGTSVATTRPVPAKPKATRLSETQAAATLEFLKKQRPDYYPRFVKLKNHNPRHYRNILAKWYRIMQRRNAMPVEIRHAADNEKQMQIEVAKFVQSIRMAVGGSDKAKLEAELRKRVLAHFEAEQRLNKLRMEQLEIRIREVRRELRLKRKQQDEIIDERVGLWMRATKPAVRPATSPKDVPAEAD